LSVSATWRFVLRPEVAAVSAGYLTRYRHPNPDALARYAAAGIRLYRTDLHGAITVDLSGPRVVVAPYVRAE